MVYDKKQFLDLLQEYRSDEVKKARRNTSVISFVILSAWFLDLHLSSMSVLGMNVSRASETRVLVVAAVLLIYWTAMFLLAWTQDLEIQKERTFILDEQVAHITMRYGQIEANKKIKNSDWQLGNPDHRDIYASMKAIQLQKKRTKRAMRVVTWIRRLEFYVPLVMSGSAALSLVVMFFHVG